VSGTRVPLPSLSSDPDSWSATRGVVVEIADHRILLLPFAAPTGPSRGRRYELLWGDGRRTHAVVLSLDGRAAVAPPAGLACGSGDGVEVRLRPLRERRAHLEPADVRDRLAADGLSPAAVPTGEWAHMLAMVRESSTPAVRAARIDAAVSVVRAWNERARGARTP